MALTVRQELMDLSISMMNGQSNSEHAGLALDAFQPLSSASKSNEHLEYGYGPVPEGASPLSWFLDRVAHIPVSSAYKTAYKDWTNTLAAIPGVRTQPVSASRMIIGLGEETVRETGISLLEPYGVPFIPGKALKGLVKHYCEQSIARLEQGHSLMPRLTGKLTLEQQRQNCENLHHFIFGDQASASYFTFHDAWLIPDTDVQQSLKREVIAVHHPGYYNAAPGQRLEPWDLDDPIPVSFLGSHGSFLLVIEGPDPAGQWSSEILKLAEDALTNRGIGAKTSSDFGYFTRAEAPVEEGEPELTEREIKAYEKGLALVAEIRALSAAEAIRKQGSQTVIQALCTRAIQLEDRAMRIAAQRAVYDKVVEAGKLGEWSNHGWVKKLIGFLNQNKS